MSRPSVADLLVRTTDIVDDLRVDGIEGCMAWDDRDLKAVVLQAKGCVVVALRREDFEAV